MQVQLGLVWVWPETGPEALLESGAKQPACCQLVKDVNPGIAIPAARCMVRAMFAWQGGMDVGSGRMSRMPRV